MLEPILPRYGWRQVRGYFRADVAFAKPEVHGYLEERRFLYTVRRPSNKVL